MPQSWTSLDYDVSGSTDQIAGTSKNYVTFKEPVLFSSVYNAGGKNKGVSPGSIWNIPSVNFLAGGQRIEYATDNQGNVWALSYRANNSAPIGEPTDPVFAGDIFQWGAFNTGAGISNSGVSSAQ